MTAQLYVVELVFNDNNDTDIDHEGIERVITDILMHLNDRGILSSLCNPPSIADVVSVNAIQNRPAFTVVLRK